MVLKIKESLHTARHTLTDIVHNTLFGKPDVTIMGEFHTDEGHTIDQARRILRHRPEYTLLEGLNDLNPEDTQNLISRYEMATLQDLSLAMGIDPRQMGIGEEILGKIAETFNQDLNTAIDFCKEWGMDDKEAKKQALEYVKDGGEVPSNYRQVLETPFYQFNPAVFEALGDSISIKSLEYARQGERSLSQRVGNITKFLLPFKYTRSEDDRVYRAIAQVGGKLAGCDIKKEIPEADIPELETDKDIPEAAAEDVAGRMVEYLDSLGDYVTENNQAREQEMGKRISKFVGQRETSRPIIAIVGKGHTERDSEIYSVLDEAGVKYRVIRQKSFGRDGLKDALYSFKLGMK
tara:strand:+ start:209 stop:1255 length:1047 start_codon:yes stop_codon:yes gene_type:complete